MRRKIEGLRANIEEFVEQTDYSVLLVACTPVEGMYVSQFLIALDEIQIDSYFLVFADPFVDAASYVDALARSLDVQLKAGSELRLRRDERPFEPVPAEVTDRRRDPSQRLEALLQFFPRLLDEGYEQSVVVGLLPTECADEEAFAQLVGSVLLHQERPEWMKRLRIVTLDPPERPQLVPVLQREKLSTVLTFRLDLSTPALTAALSQEAADPGIPLAERMSNLHQLAAVDFSYQRHADAQDKYTMLYEYYGQVEQPGMQALCLQGTADSLEATGEPAKAKLLLEQGINLCLKHDQKLQLLFLLVSMVRVCRLLELHDQAEMYAHSGLTIALAVVNAPVYVFLLEQEGDAQLAQRKRPEAIATYDRARKLAELYKLYSIWKSVLEKLDAEHARVGHDDLASDMRREWRRADDLERSGGGSKPDAHAGEPAQAHAHG
ncbi:MAG TPA: hypothetical protein VNN80_07520 [Polyangiaceae bacterium]|nr:hypothetical protein [Polyangiaceae bacterium]